MDTVIVGILIIVVTGVLIAIVRRRASRPRPPIDVGFSDGGTYDVPDDHGGTGSYDGDFGH